MAHVRKYGFHYAWVVFVAAGILNIVARADQSSFGVFIDPLVDQFGWSRGDISFAYSVAFIAGLPAVVIMGWLGDRFGARMLMLGAALLIGVGTVLMGTIKELWHFYLIYGFMVGSMGHAAYSVLLPVIMTRWFAKQLGIVMGVYFACQGLGPVIFAPLFRWLLETQGWDHTFLLIGVVLGCILAFFSLFIYNSPADKGLQAYGGDGASPAPAPAAVAARTGAQAAAPVRLRELLRQRMVWKLIGIHHVGCISHAIILTQVVSMATFKGIPGVEAAGVLATIAGSSVVSRVAFSIMADKVGGRITLTLSLLGQSLPVILLFFASDAWSFYLFAVIFGLCYGGEMVGFPIINKQLFGDKAPLGSIYSIEMVGAGVGMALGGWLGGALFDFTGSYAWSLSTSLTVGLLGLPLALSLPRHRPPGPGREERVPAPAAAQPSPALS